METRPQWRPRTDGLVSQLLILIRLLLKCYSFIYYLVSQVPACKSFLQKYMLVSYTNSLTNGTFLESLKKIKIGRRLCAIDGTFTQKLYVMCVCFSFW